jgi:hypothetical protein
MREEVPHSERGESTYECTGALGAEDTMRNVRPEIPHANRSESAYEGAGSLQELLQSLWPAIPE